MLRGWDWFAWPPRPGSWGKDPLRLTEDLVTSCLALPDQCGNCIRLPRLPRPLGNVMRLLKWGPGPGGIWGPPPDRAGCGHSFPETQPGSADRLADRFGLEKQAPRGWRGACCLGLPGERASRVGSRQICGGGQEPLIPARMDFLEPSMLQRDKVRLRDTEGYAQCPRAKSVGDTQKHPVLFFQPKGLPAVLLPKNPQDTPNVTEAGSGMRAFVSYSAPSPPSCGILV